MVGNDANYSNAIYFISQFYRVAQIHGYLI
jgi:hypothetical protein